MHKKVNWPRNRLLLKNLQFLPNHYETWPKLATHESLILTKFHSAWIKIVEFLIIAYIWASVIFYYSVSKSEFEIFLIKYLLKLGKLYYSSY